MLEEHIYTFFSEFPYMSWYAEATAAKCALLRSQNMCTKVFSSVPNFFSPALYNDFASFKAASRSTSTPSYRCVLTYDSKSYSHVRKQIRAIFFNLSNKKE